MILLEERRWPPAEAADPAVRVADHATQSESSTSFVPFCSTPDANTRDIIVFALAGTGKRDVRHLQVFGPRIRHLTLGRGDRSQYEAASSQPGEDYEYFGSGTRAIERWAIERRAAEVRAEEGSEPRTVFRPGWLAARGRWRIAERGA
jgi:hypothetical protein